MDEIKLKPLSEGLGLNHFADGLPYAPASTRRKPMVQFNFPQRPQQPQAQLPPAPPSLMPSPKLESAVASAVESQVFAQKPLNLIYASFLRRAMAYAVDLAVSIGLFAIIVWASFALNGYELRSLGAQILWPLTLLYIVVQMGYFLIQETTWRCTIGKALMGIRIHSPSGFSTLGRAFCFFVSALPFGIGLLWYFFDSRRRCWHDVITDSEVVCR